MKKADKKADKKTDKKKSTKKKSVKKSKNALGFDSKLLQKEFNKRMKMLVQEVKKDTQKTIKGLMKEAKSKIQASSDFVRNDVLKSIVTEYESVTGTNQEEAPKPARKTRVKAADADTAAATPATRKKTTAGTAKKTAAGGQAKTTRTRKTTPPAMTADNTNEGQAA